jgi:4-amino-4-deoxy-L-arabinose transferase-like glycosyltransferase
MPVHTNYYGKFRVGGFWSENRLLMLLMVAALALRLIVLFTEGNRMFLGTDDENYYESAEILLRSGILTYGGWKEPTVFIMPGYPLFLAGIFWLAGSTSWLAARLIQVLISIAALWFTVKLGIRLGGRWAGIAAGVLAAIYPPNLTSPCFLLTETVFTCLLLLSLLAFIKAKDSRSIGWYAVTGLAVAMATYFRPTSGLLPVVFGVYLLLRGHPWRQTMINVVIMGTVIGLCLSPWIIRNYLNYQEFIPFTVSGGNPFLRGTYLNDEINDEFPWVQGDRILSDKAQMEYGKKRFMEGFQNDFRTYLRWYTVGKFAGFWGEPYYYKELTYLPAKWVTLFHQLILALGAGGIIACLWHKRSRGLAWLFLLVSGYFTVLHLLYLTGPRYSYPVMQLLIIQAAYLASWLRSPEVENA